MMLDDWGCGIFWMNHLSALGTDAYFITLQCRRCLYKLVRWYFCFKSKEEAYLYNTECNWCLTTLKKKTNHKKINHTNNKGL